MLARFYAMLFRGNIAYLLTALNVITEQLKNRAAEAIHSAEAREEAAAVLLGEASEDRAAARVAVNLADKLTKLTK